MAVRLSLPDIGHKEISWERSLIKREQQRFSFLRILLCVEWHVALCSGCKSHFLLLPNPHPNPVDSDGGVIFAALYLARPRVVV